MKTIDILKLTLEKKMNGIFIKGDINDGEWKEWWPNGQLYLHCFIKNHRSEGKVERWHRNGMRMEADENFRRFKINS